MADKAALIGAMKEVFGDDQRRINHALKVTEHAEALLSEVPANRAVALAAAVLHDIGIHEAERKHGSSAGKWQEMEGPPIARRILTGLREPEEFISAVCGIVGSHHTAGKVDSPEFDTVWDADWLVNLDEEGLARDRSKLAASIGRVFRTEAGRRRAVAAYALSPEDRMTRSEGSKDMGSAQSPGDKPG